MNIVKKLKDPFVLDIVITVLYLGAIAYETLIASASAGWVEDNKLNILGDFLAGVFAPVAFLWLIVTVFLQKQELALTRNEMVETRQVMLEQAAEAKAHKDFVEQQTAIMKRQSELAERTYEKNKKLDLFDKRMQVYIEIKLFVSLDVDRIDTDENANEFIHLMNRAMFLFAGDSKIIQWMTDLNKVAFLSGNFVTDEKSEVWGDLTDPRRFHHLFSPYLTMHE